MLKVENVSKVYATPRGPLEVLRDVTFTLSPGEAAAITGPSGSGKSSLLYILGALDPPSSGVVTLDGRDPFTLGAKAIAGFRNAAIGFVFQDHCLLPQCSVLENVLVPTLVAPKARRPGPSGKGRRPGPFGPGNDNDADDVGRARALVEQVGLADRIDHRPAALSGGEKQRVALARALILQPRLVLCDEPTGNLDQASAAAVAELLLDLHRHQQNILVVVTHSERLAAQFPIRFDIADKQLRRVA